MFHIVADSGCDLFALAGASLSIAPLTISTGTVHYRDDENLNCAMMIEELLAHKGRSFTSCPCLEDWLEAFTPKDGTIPDELYIVTLTSALSGTYNSAMLARDAYLEKHPGVKIAVIDSLSVGPEMRLLMEKIVQLKAQGLSFAETVEQVRAYSKQTRLFFAFRSLHNLAQNGRVSKLVAAAAGVLGISVYGTASEKGQIESMGKARGDKRVITSLLDAMTEAGFKGGRVCISHTENEELAQKLADAVLARVPGSDVVIYPVRGLCSYYCERGGICVACETE